MRIRRLRVEGFGNLKGDFIFSSDRCNLILEPNESGKSTLAAALLAALYGFSRGRATREKPIRMKEQYRPWAGGPYAIEMELEYQDRFFIVKRDFDSDTAAILDGRSGRDITAEFSRSKDHLDFAETLTGLTREDFARCCFVGQQEIGNLRDASSLTHALQRIASSQQGDVVAGEALDALSRAIDRDYQGMKLGRGKVETEIKRLEKEIDEVRAEMEAIAARRRDSEEKIRRLEEATDREDQVEGSITRVDYLWLLAARQEVDATLEQRRRDLAEIDGYRGEIDALASSAGFPAQKLGELRELKGKIESLEQRRDSFEKRLVAEVETPMREAEQAMRPLASFEALTEPDIALASDRQAVLGELWGLRRGKRRALRKEERRLTAAGVDPARVTELAGRLSGLSAEDRAWLATYRERLAEVRAALSESERDRDRLVQAEGGGSTRLVSLAKARRAESLALVAGISGLALSFVLWLSFASKIPFAVAIGIALSGFAYWLFLLENHPKHGAEEFGTDLQRLQTEIWAREKEQAALQERLLELASRAGDTKPERLVEEFRELETLQEKAAPVAALAASVQEAQNRYAAAAEELLDLMNRAGRPPSSRLVTPRVARRFRAELDQHLEIRQRLNTMRAALETGVEELGAIVLEIKTLRAAAGSLLVSALGPGGEHSDLSTMLHRFEEAAAKKERLDRLVREVLPAAERRGSEAAGQGIERLSRDREVLSRQIERALKADPGMQDLNPSRTSREYAEERRQLQEESRRTLRDRLALSEELGDVLKEYRRDYPGRQSLLASLETTRVRAVAFRDAIEIARDVLTEISREAYAEWAEVLNEKSSGILRRLNPHYEDVRFDTDLSFTLRDGRTGQRLDQAAVDAQFSAGARDQIYLSVRMAAAEYLSAAGVRLPFILDDPFATFDDERFARAMEFLLDTVGRRHQVILLSCHAARHRSWQESAPGQIADRVRLVDLTPLSM